jgi:hypothetical protein
LITFEKQKKKNIKVKTKAFDNHAEKFHQNMCFLSIKRISCLPKKREIGA